MSIYNDINNSFPPGLRNFPIYPKVSEMIQYVIEKSNDYFKDSKYKYKEPSLLSEDAINRVIKEFGYEYISNIMDTLTDIEFDTLVYFLGMISLMKGHRDGLELVLRLLEIDSTIVEWWETTPKREPYTFDIVVFINTSKTLNIYNTLDKIREFITHYVYPTFEKIELVFSFNMADISANMAGFHKRELTGTITASI
jgi:hypothetical protein